MTRLALGAKSSGFTAPFDPWFAAWAARSSDGFNREFNAVSPSPAEARPRKALRVAVLTRCSIIALIPCVDFVQVQNRARNHRHCRQKRLAVVVYSRRLTFAQEIVGARGVRGKTLQISLE